MFKKVWGSVHSAPSRKGFLAPKTPNSQVLCLVWVWEKCLVCTAPGACPPSAHLVSCHFNHPYFRIQASQQRHQPLCLWASHCPITQVKDLVHITYSSNACWMNEWRDDSNPQMCPLSIGWSLSFKASYESHTLHSPKWTLLYIEATVYRHILHYQTSDLIFMLFFLLWIHLFSLYPNSI